MEAHSDTFTALCEALDDEYKARATYRAVLQRFGPVLPFANIVASEECHIQALLPLFTCRGWTPPADRWDGAMAAPQTFGEACRVGVEAEIENVTLYDRLFSLVQDQDVLSVFRVLQHASAECHLPAFRRGLEGGGAAGACGCGGHRREHDREQRQNGHGCCGH